MANRSQGSSGAPPLPSSYPSIGTMPRRSSYASVAAGTAAASDHLERHSGRTVNIPQAMRQNLSSNTFISPSTGDHLPRMSRTADGLESRGNNTEGASNGASLGKGAGRSNRTSQFLHYQGYGLPGHGGISMHGLPKPTYLRGSRYMEKLEAAHKAKPASQRDAHSNHSSGQGSLSTSSSSVSLHKLAPSYRGMTHEIIEHQPPVDEDGPAPLPSKWAEVDKYGGLEISPNGFDIKYVGPSKLHEHEGAAARADHPMPPQCGIYFYEVTVVSNGKDEMIGIGFSGSKASLEKLPGWEPESWAYHGDDGKSFCGQSHGNSYGPKFTTGDVIGCGVNFMTGCAFFTKNGVFQEIAFRGLKDVSLYPSVGMRRPQAHLTVNFGQRPFIFDIDGMVAREKANIVNEINLTSASKLHSCLNETALFKELVAQFLAHDGYVESAKAFAEEVRSEENALKNGPVATLGNFSVEDNLDAVNRQHIRAAILEGDIDKALKRTKAFYPHVLEDNSRIYFRLRCRKFVEMIRKSTELLDGSTERHAKSTNGQSTTVSDDEFEPEMDLDDQGNSADDWDKMETEEVDNGLKYQDLLASAVQYGRELRYEFKDDRSKHVEDAFTDIFSMFAYEDPRKSPTSHLLDRSGRVPVAEELNSAILVSLGKSSSAAIERLYQQAEVLVSDLSEEGGAGAFINIRNDFLL